MTDRRAGAGARAQVARASTGSTRSCCSRTTLGGRAAWLLAHDDAAARRRRSSALAAPTVARRADGVPLAYLIGEREFHGLRLHVDARRAGAAPDTETLVDWALELRGADAGAATSSTWAPAAARSRWPSSTPARAPRCAPPTAARRRSRSRAATPRRLGLDVDWSDGDWWQALPRQRFDLVVSQPALRRRRRSPPGRAAARAGAGADARPSTAWRRSSGSSPAPALTCAAARGCCSNTATTRRRRSCLPASPRLRRRDHPQRPGRLGAVHGRQARR